MPALLDPQDIPHTRKDYRKWMDFAGFELERLDMIDTDIWTNYWRNSTEDNAQRERNAALCDLKCDLLGLKYAIQATMALWRKHRDEMS